MAIPMQSFGVRFRSFVTTFAGDTYTLIFSEDGYSGAASAGPEVVSIDVEYGARGKTYGLLASRARLTLFDPSLDLGNAIVDSKERQWRLEIMQGSIRLWEGYILPSNIEQNVSERGRMVRLDATDGVSSLYDYRYDERELGWARASEVLYQAFQRVNQRASEQRINNVITPFVQPQQLTGHEVLSSLYLRRAELADLTWGEIIDTEICQRLGILACYRDDGFDVFDLHSIGAGSYTMQHVGADGARTSGTTAVSAIMPADYEVLEGATIEASPQSNQVAVAWAHGPDVAYSDEQVMNGGFDANADDWTVVEPGNGVRQRVDGSNGVYAMPGRRTGTQTPSRYIWQDVDVGEAEAQYGVRFSFRARWWINGVTNPSAVTGAKVFYRLRLTTDGNDVHYWDAPRREWVTADTLNEHDVAGIFTSTQFDTAALPDIGTVRIELYEGVDARNPGQSAITRYYYDDVSLRYVDAVDDQVQLTTIRVTDTSQNAAQLTELPGGTNGFVFGSATEGEYDGRIALNASGIDKATGWKVGRYTDDPTTGHTLDEALARHTLAWRGKLGKTLNAELNVKTVFWAPSMPFLYEGEYYLLTSLRHDLLRRKMRVLALRIAPVVPNDNALSTDTIFDATAGGGGRGGSAPAGGGGITRVNSDLTLSGEGTGASPLSVTVPVPALAGASDAGKVLTANAEGTGFMWDDPAESGTTLPAFREADHGKVLTVKDPNLNMAGDDPVLEWVTPTDADTTYTAGAGISLSGTVFNVDIPVPSYVSGNAGQLLRVNAEADGIEWAGLTRSDISDFPTLAAVATSGDYGDLSNTPAPVTSLAWSAITGKPGRIGAFTAADETKLDGIEAGAEVNVQADWNQTTNTADSFIKNKPTLAAVATSGAYGDLSGLPTIPTVHDPYAWTLGGTSIARNDAVVLGNGLAWDASTKTVSIGAGEGITVNATEVAVTRPVPVYKAVNSNQVLKVNSVGDGLVWAEDTDTLYTGGDGIDITEQAVKVDIEAGGGLEIASGKLRVDIFDVDTTVGTEDPHGVYMMGRQLLADGSFNPDWWFHLQIDPSILRGVSTGSKAYNTLSLGLPAYVKADNNKALVIHDADPDDDDVSPVVRWETLSYANIDGAPTYGNGLSQTGLSVKVVAGTGVTVNASGVNVDYPVPAYVEADHGKALFVVDPDTSTSGSTPTIEWRGILAADVSGLEAVATSGAYGDLSGTPVLAAIALSGAYADLSGTPTAGSGMTLTGTVFSVDVPVPQPADDTNGFALFATDSDTNTAGTKPTLAWRQIAAVDVSGLADIATSGAAADVAGLATVATSGAYSDLSGTPLPYAWTFGGTSILRSDAVVLGNGISWDSSTKTISARIGQGLRTAGGQTRVRAGTGITVNSMGVNVTRPVPAYGSAGQYLAVLSDASGTEWKTLNYTDIDGTPVLAAVATSGAYGDLSGTPVLATVATSGMYIDLDGLPTFEETLYLAYSETTLPDLALPNNDWGYQETETVYLEEVTWYASQMPPDFGRGAGKKRVLWESVISNMFDASAMVWSKPFVRERNGVSQVPQTRDNFLWIYFASNSETDVPPLPPNDTSVVGNTAAGETLTGQGSPVTWSIDPVGLTKDNAFGWITRRVYTGVPSVGDPIAAEWETPQLVSSLAGSVPAFGSGNANQVLQVNPGGSGLQWANAAEASGTIQNVIAGSGLMGGGTTAVVTLSVRGGAGLTVVDSGEVRVTRPVPAYDDDNANQVLTVNAAGNALIWTDKGGGGGSNDGNSYVTGGSYSAGSITLTRNDSLSDIVIAGIPQGDITGVTAGDGLTGGGASGSVTLAVGAGTGITVNAGNVAVTNPIPAFDTNNNGQVLKVVEGALAWAADESGSGGGSGDITGVSAGDGLTGGGDMGAVTLNVGAGNGITVAANTVSVNAANGITVGSSGVSVNAHTGITVDANGVSVTRPVPAFSASNNGQVLKVVSGALAWAADSVGSNNYVTGGSVSGTTLTLTREGLSDLVISGLPSGGGGGGTTYTAGAGIDINASNAISFRVNRGETLEAMEVVSSGSSSRSIIKFGVGLSIFSSYASPTSNSSSGLDLGGVSGDDGYLCIFRNSQILVGADVGDDFVFGDRLARIIFTELSNLEVDENATVTTTHVRFVPEATESNNGQVLTVVNGVPAWGTVNSAGLTAGDGIDIGANAVSVKVNSGETLNIFGAVAFNEQARINFGSGILIESTRGSAGSALSQMTVLSDGVFNLGSDSQFNVHLNTSVVTSNPRFVPEATTSNNGQVLKVVSGVPAWATDNAGSGGGTGDITSVTAGNKLSGGGTSGAVTLNHATQSFTGTKGTTGNNAIQTITIDAYGHITGITSTPKMHQWFFGSGSSRQVMGHRATAYVDAGTGIGTAFNGSSSASRVTVSASSSDSRLKKDVATLGDSLSVIKQLRPVTFAWKQPDGYPVGHKAAGFIAQEVEPVFARAVLCCTDRSVDADGNITQLDLVGDKENGIDPDAPATGSNMLRHIDVRAIAALNTKGIQELLALVEAHTARLDALESAP